MDQTSLLDVDLIILTLHNIKFATGTAPTNFIIPMVAINKFNTVLLGIKIIIKMKKNF